MEFRGLGLRVCGFRAWGLGFGEGWYMLCMYIVYIYIYVHTYVGHLPGRGMSGCFVGMYLHKYGATPPKTKDIQGPGRCIRIWLKGLGLRMLKKFRV